MELSVIDRIALATIIPDGSNMVDRALIRSIGEKTALSEEETDICEVVVTDKGGISVNVPNAKAAVVDIEFSSGEIAFLKKCVEKASKKEGVTDTNYDVCLKIQEEKLSA